MRIDKCIGCRSWPCSDVDNDCYRAPSADVDAEAVRIVLISEAAPADPADYYYAKGKPLFAETTLQAFADAGAEVSTVRGLLDMGVYMTTAIKCGKVGYTIKAGAVKECSKILAEEIALFPNVRAYLLMGDAAIKAVNYIAKSLGAPRVIPAGSTYKIRGPVYTFRDARAFPSYLQAGPAFFIEKSKRRMIAEDIAAALKLADA